MDYKEEVVGWIRRRKWLDRLEGESVKRYTLELYNDYSYLALYKFFDFHSCLNVDI